MLLVLSNGGYLAPPDEKPEQEKMWTETWKKVNRFLPQFFGELFPEEAEKPNKEREMPVREKKEAENEKVDVVQEGEKAEVEEEEDDEEEDEDGEDEKAEKTV